MYTEQLSRGGVGAMDLGGWGCAGAVQALSERENMDLVQ
jgi:hypothetical protein